MKKILIISRALSGGGAEKIAADLATILSNSKENEVYFCVFNTENATYELGEKVKLIDLNLREYTKFSYANWLVKAIKGVKKIKNEKEIDCSISFLSEPSLANVFSGGKKNIVSVRNKQSKFINSRIKFLIEKKIYGKADIVIPISEMVKKDLHENFDVPLRKMQVIYNMVDKNYLKSKSLEHIDNSTEKLLEKKQVLINFGRLVDQKGQWHLIRAFSKVKKEVDDAHLLILGEGINKEYLLNLVKGYGLENDITLLGYKKNPYEYMKYSKLFLFSSLYEGLGNSILESMALNVPIISTDCDSGPRELLCPESDINDTGKQVGSAYRGKYGILCPNFDGKKYNYDEYLTIEETIFSEEIIRLLNNNNIYDEYQDRLSERTDDFSPNHILKQWLKVINGEKF